MATVKHHKVVAALPAVLEANAIYYVRAGQGHDAYVTNGSGLIVGYPSNAQLGLAELDPSGLPAIRPTLNLDFINRRFVDPRVTFARASGGGRFNAQGVYEWLPANTPRIDYDPVTGECLGLLIEEQRTRLNTVALAPTAAQSVTVTAVAHTISFYGAGTITLSGTHTATVAGSGAYPSRRTYTFTPTAGTLTITPTGDVQMLQLETGLFATSWIQGEGSQVTRAADFASVNTLAPWYNPVEGTLFADVLRGDIVTKRTSGFVRFVGVDSTNSIRLEPGIAWPTTERLYVTLDGNVQVQLTLGHAIPGGTSKLAAAYRENDFGFSRNGAATISVNSGLIPDVQSMQIGQGMVSGHIRSIRYYPRRLSNTELQALTA